MKMINKLANDRTGRFRVANTNSFLLSTIFILIIATIAAGQGLHDTYLNGIYFDSDGRPQYPLITDTADTSIFMFNTPSHWSTGLARQSATVYWLADSDVFNSKLYKISQTGYIWSAYDAPLNGYAGLCYANNKIWAIHEDHWQLHRINPTTGLADTMIALPRPDTTYPNRYPWGIAWDGHYFWHSQYGTDAMIFKIDPATWTAVDTIMLNVHLILAITYKEPYLYGIHIGNRRIYRFDPETGENIDSYMWPIHYPMGLFYDTNTGNFVNVSSSAEYGGDEAVYQVSLTVNTDIDDNGGTLPLSPEMITAYPNPFNAATTIQYTLSGETQVTLDIYNLLGQKVECLVDMTQPAGDYTINWRPQGIPSGMYFARIYGASFDRSVKLLLLK
jgi:hypothetical protein